jgi:hypothetical protein
LPIHLICSFFCQLPSYIQFRYLNVTPTNVHYHYAIKSEDCGEKVHKRGIYSQPPPDTPSLSRNRDGTWVSSTREV